MKHSTELGIIVILLVWLLPLYAQNDCGDGCKINSNLGMVVNVPVGSTAQVASTGWGIDGGVGYNFNKRNALIGEFMWNRVTPASGSLQALQSALQSRNLNGTTDLYMVTGNYRFELRGRFVGAYLIGGGGLYVRYSNLSKTVTANSGTVCTPAWLWWGLRCTSGTVTYSQTLRSSTSSVFGGNAGAGVTFRVGHAPYRTYAEARYNYAPTKNIYTRFVAVTFGIRY